MATSGFVNRTEELRQLAQWFDRPGPTMAAVWGRKRVGKTWLVDHFAQGHRWFRHICRPGPHEKELAQIAQKAHPVVSTRRRSLLDQPFTSWQDALGVLAEASTGQPIVMILDEFPELLRTEPTFDKDLRAIWDQIVLGEPCNLKVVLCGSAVSIMEAIQAESAPLYGRFDLRLHVKPFKPHEAALMLPGLSPEERAAAWGVCGGIPRFLSLWDDSLSFKENLEQLVVNEHGILLSEGELILGDEEVSGAKLQHLPEQVLRAIAAGSTSFSAISHEVSGLPTRTLDRLCELRLIERVNPVTQDPAVTKLSYYRIADNFLAFWLSCVEPHREAVETGLARSVLGIIVEEFSDFMGPRYEQAFRAHLRRIAPDGSLGSDAVAAVGEWWRSRGGPGEDQCQLDALVLAGRKRAPVAVGEAKWAQKANGSSLKGAMKRKVLDAKLVPDADALTYVVCARSTVERSDGMLAVTAADIFG